MKKLMADGSWLMVFSFCVLVFSFPLFAEEKFTITTYYPAPFGVYQRLVTSTLGVGDTNASGGIDAVDAPDPTVADQAGDVWIAGDVGVGTGRFPEKIGGLPRTVDIRGYLTLTTQNPNLTPGVMYTSSSSDPNFDEELVITMGRDSDHNGISNSEGGDDRSRIWIGPKPGNGGVGQIQLNAKTVYISKASVGIGTDKPSVGDQPLKLDVAGAIGAQYFCDTNGNNCVTPPLGGGAVAAPSGGCKWRKAVKPNDHIQCGEGEVMAGIQFESPTWDGGSDSHSAPEIPAILCCTLEVGATPQTYPLPPKELKLDKPTNYPYKTTNFPISQ